MKDAIRLADLQLQLLAVDAAEFWKQAKLGLVGAVMAAVVFMASITLLMFGLAEFLESTAGFSPEAAKSSVAAGALLFAGLVLGLSLRHLTRAGGTLNRSCGELQENLNWLRSILSQDDEPAAR